MEAITKKIRTPEEIVAWFNAARQRKAAWEKETKAELRSIVEESRRAKESHYLSISRHPVIPKSPRQSSVL